MNRRIKCLIIPLIAVCLMGAGAGQLMAQRATVSVMTPRLEELPRIAIDTINTADKETKIIVYTNNTWSYYRPTLNTKYDKMAVFNEHWDSVQVFAYRSIELASLPQSIDINLISSIRDFTPPFKGRVFSKYGPRGRRNHNGVDIPLKVGDPIRAAFDGRVRYARYNTGGFGYLVILRHENGLETWHAHLSRLNVASGDYVKSGQVIGFGGNTGRSRGPHLHFEVRYCDQTFDPERIFDFENGDLKYQTFVLEKAFLNINSRASDELEEHDFEDYVSLPGEGGAEVTSEDILNHIAKAQTLIPENKPLPAGQSTAVYHTIKSGDMLGKLAVRYGVSIDQICRLNSITRTTTLKLGRKLRIK